MNDTTHRVDFDDLIGDVLKREGGYVNHPADRGGPTKFGITHDTYRAWRVKRGQKPQSVEDLTHDEAVMIYFENYWRAANCPALPTQVRDIHFDAAVQHGVRRAAVMLQTAAGATQDGYIGPLTIKACFAMEQMLLRLRYTVTRYRFYGDIINRDRSQLAFMAGWMNRMREFG